MKKLAIIAIAAIAGVSSAVVYSNGPVTDGNSGGPLSNQPNSQIMAGGTLYGFGCQTTAGNRMADDFTVTGAGWNITRISFFSYQSFAATTFTFTGADVSIVAGTDPSAAATEYNVANAAVTNGGFVGYRVTSTTLTNTDRAIYRVSVAVPNLILGAGSHMLRWSLTGSLASGPWAPPVVPTPQGGGNAFQFLPTPVPGAWNPALDGATRMELPFEIEYTAVPEPATMLALGAGLAAIAARRRRK